MIFWYFPVDSGFSFSIIAGLITLSGRQSTIYSHLGGVLEYREYGDYCICISIQGVYIHISVAVVRDVKIRLYRRIAVTGY
jgi:hypothetical protein